MAWIRNPPTGLVYRDPSRVEPEGPPESRAAPVASRDAAPEDAEDCHRLVHRMADEPDALGRAVTRYGPAAMQVGTLAWADATNGALRAGERAALLAPLLRTAGAYAAGRLRLALGLRGAGGLDLDALAVPDSRLVQLAEEECRDTLTACMAEHSRRTFLFGLALARCDGVAVDVEHLYVTSLLHDIALESPDASGCFAVRGGRTMQALALRAGCDAPLAETLAEAIALHITPGVGFERGPLAPLIQSGAMVDLTGSRLWDLRADFVAGVLARHPRLGMKQHLGACWRREAAAFAPGRAAFIERFGAFSRFVRWAPYPE